MKSKFFLYGALVMLLTLVSVGAKAQIGPGRLYSFTLDTVTNTATADFTFMKQLDDSYDYTWQVTATNISGTTNVTAYVQERLPGQTSWVNRDTLSYTGTASMFSTGVNVGIEQRLHIVSAGTHSTSVRGVVWYRRKKS